MQTSDPRPLMTPEEIHEFGIQIVAQELEKEGNQVIGVNTTLAENPQVIAKVKGELALVVVRTAVYPGKGEIESDELALQLIAHAHAHRATCYFASVGIANMEGTNDAEMSVPVRGAGYHVAFEGLQVMTRGDRAKIWKEDGQIVDLDIAKGGRT